jgi:two-component system CheB/CheR fusion protein
MARKSPEPRKSAGLSSKRGGATSSSDDKDKSKILLIVGIGASAGGLEAFKSFFTNTPADTGMAFVLVQHLSPDYKSMLTELLGNVTEMGVVEATDGMEVKPNCVFIIPPDATLTILKGRLKVDRPAPPRDRRRPIDTFFQSLAEDQGENAICIILAGTGSDGTLGAAAIKEHGGLTLAQSEYDSHALPGMPQSAAATGQVDDVLAVEAMPARIIAYHKHLTEVAGRKDAGGFRQDAASNLATIIGALRARSGHDFSEYKEKTLLRRLQRRMQVLQVETPAAYIERFRDQPEELDMLFRELLIGVTQFFRDPAAFEALASEVIKGLVAGKGADDDIRVWVPGCSTGQEAYSLAILIREAMDTRRGGPKVQIFGTDIDDRAIALARLGRYRKPVAGLSAERLDRWFTEERDDYCVPAEIREMCVFSTHSIIKHPPFSKLDLISCRNLLIYIDADMQDRVMRTFHYSLKPGGRLFLGSSESVTRATKLFSVKDKKHRIFERREVEEATLPDLSGIGRRLEPSPTPTTLRSQSDDRIDRVARRVTEKHNPPHVVVDGHDQIVRFSGAAMVQYVELASGAPSYALFDILRKALRPSARAALKEARATKVAVRQENVPIRIDGLARLVTLIAEPLADQASEPGFVALIFQDVGVGGPGGLAVQMSGEATDVVKALEQELRTTRTQLQSTIDELEVANEELKSSNEEHQSVNEELQSSNEELETAKEEMQSVNEEVQTINSEMASKNEQLTTLNSDLKNLLESTEIATLFLDGQLRVKSFTPAVTDIFHLRDGDVGRPVTEIVSLLDYSEMQRDVKTVLRKLTPIEREVKLKETGATFVLRVRPYRTVENVIEGVVLTFVDISARHAADQALRQSEAQFHALAESIPQLAWIMDGEGSIFWYNRRWFDYTGTKLEDMQGWGWRSVHDPAEVARVEAHLRHCIETGILWEDTFSLRGADGVYRWFLSRAEPIRDESGQIVRWFGTNTDIEEQRRSEQKNGLLLRELDHRVKNLFAIVTGMVTLSARSATTPQELAKTVQGRLGALAISHRLISPRELAPAGINQDTTLGELVRTVLSPYVDPSGTGDNARAVIDGAEVVISGEAVKNLALILHELATNAAKYGALSVPTGQVHIAWTVKRGRLALTWAERGGPPVKGAPAREGFGSVLARRSIGGQLEGKLEFDWKPDGLVARIEAPTERLTP